MTLLNDRNVHNLTIAEYAGEILQARSGPTIDNPSDRVRAAFSTVGGAAALRAFFNASILQGYRDATDSLANCYRKIDAPNYLLNELGTLDVHPRLTRLARGDTAPAVAFSIAAGGFRLAKFAAQFVLDEQDIEDGRVLGIYGLAMEEVGAAARRIVQDLLLALLLSNPTLGDGTALFAAERGNLATAALGAEALDTRDGRDRRQDQRRRGCRPGSPGADPECFGGAAGTAGKRQKALPRHANRQRDGP